VHCTNTCSAEVVDFTKPSGNNSTHPKLFQWIKDYFMKTQSSDQWLGTTKLSSSSSTVTSSITTKQQPSHSACANYSSAKPESSNKDNEHGEPDRKRTKFGSVDNSGKLIWIISTFRDSCILYRSCYIHYWNC